MGGGLGHGHEGVLGWICRESEPDIHLKLAAYWGDDSTGTAVLAPVESVVI